LDENGPGQAPRLEICGGIASGKTTLAGLLTAYGFEAVFEDFRANPFWRAFYAEPARYAFETEVTFLLQHYHTIRKRAEGNGLLVCDFSFVLDRAYVDVTLRDAKRSTFLNAFDEVQRKLGTPNLLVHLRCGAGTELDSVRQRARATESSISIEYLQSLNDAVERHANAAAATVRTLCIDGNRQNFATDEFTRRDVAEMVRAEFSSLR
jgi:deoxyguanosine kinase